jgi:hypothetical protein
LALLAACATRMTVAAAESRGMTAEAGKMKYNDRKTT